MAKKREIVKPDDNRKKVHVVISDALDRKYDVVYKPFPGGYQAFKKRYSSYNGKAVTWIANFGFRPKPGRNAQVDDEGFVAGDVEESYDIEFDKTDVIRVYFDGTAVREWHPGVKLGDPPVGIA